MKIGSELLFANKSYLYNTKSHERFNFRDIAVEFDGKNIVTESGIKLSYNKYREVKRKGRINVDLTRDPLSKYKRSIYDSGEYIISEYKSKEQLDAYFEKREIEYFQDMIKEAKHLDCLRDAKNRKEKVLKKYNELVAVNDKIREQLYIQETILYNKLVKESGVDVGHNFNDVAKELYETGQRKLYVDKW